MSGEETWRLGALPPVLCEICGIDHDDFICDLCGRPGFLIVRQGSRVESDKAITAVVASLIRRSILPEEGALGSGDLQLIFRSLFRRRLLF